jgi:serine/threonine-protein phosphatase Stp1
MTRPESLNGQISVVLESWGWSQRGDMKADNEDAFLCWPQRQLWAVADGVSSTVYPAAASRLLTRALLQAKPVETLEQHIKQIYRLLEDGNDILSLQRAETEAASTIVTLLMSGNNAACLWAGDSRCYMLRRGVLYQCTRDHTLRQQKIDSGELTAPEARRMVRNNVITNAVGVQRKLRLESVEFSFRPGDRFLLCSDGLTRVMQPDALLHHMSKPSAKEAVESMVETLDHLSQPDNITFVAVFVSTGL